MAKHFLVPYAYDHIESYLEPKSGFGTKTRCDCLIRHFEQMRSTGTHDTDCLFLFSAGFTKENPTAPESVSEFTRGSLAKQMSRYLTIRSPNIRYRISPRLVWGTYAETVAAIALISDCAPTDEIDVWVCSNSGHLPRIRLCWRFLTPREWKTHFLTATAQSFSWKERLVHEPVKFFVYFLRLAARKFCRR